MEFPRMRLLVMSLALLLICPITAAQVATARLEGVVRDPSGAVVPGASVSAVNSRTQAEAKTSTSSEGSFAFLSLQPGVYTLGVAAAGFPKIELPNLELTVGTTVAQDVKLKLGSPTESLEVEAVAERVQVMDAQVARAVTLRDIEVLPQIARLPIGLAIFSAGVQVDPTFIAASRVNGTRQGSTNSRLDGIDVNDSATPYLLLANTRSNMDSIEEFRIVTSGGKAEYGRNAGGQIEMITRRGTNAWHGNVFEYHRNTALNANSFFGNKQDLPTPKNILNTFGGSLGGPIHRDRTFIFGNFQGQRSAQEAVRNRLVLMPAAKAGIFQWKPPGSSEPQKFDIVANDPRRIGIDRKVAEILKLLPEHNNHDIGDGLNTAGFSFNAPIANVGDTNEDQFTIKVDHTLWSGHRLFFRWSQSRSSYIDSINNNEARFPGQPAGIQRGHNWGYSIGSDWWITPRLANELRVGYKFYTFEFYRPARLSKPMLVANSWTDPLNPAFSQRREPPVRQITDNLTIVRGRHTFKGGIEGRFTREWRSNDANSWPNVTFSRTLAAVPSSIGPYGVIISDADRTSFENLYNDLLGRMSQVTQTFQSDLKSFQPAGTPRMRTHRFREFSGFFQDDWKIHPRLVLNLGLRYEFFGVPFEVNGMQGIVDKAALVNSSARIADLTIQPGSQWYANDFNNFAPRMGLAWDPAGDGKTSLRVGWGLFYDRLIGATTNSVDARTPGYSQQVAVNPNSASTDNRLSDGDGIPLPQPPAVPELRPPTNRVTQLFLFSSNLRTGYVQHYSLTLQRQIFRNTVIEAGYVGTHGIKLFMDLNLNQPRIYEDFLPAFRELQAFRAQGTPVPASNILVRVFGSTAAAISAIGANTIDQGAAGIAADSIDRLRYPRYAQAGISDFYLRNFPQFNQVILGTNDGRSYYDSFQLSLRRQAGSLKFVANYTFSKSMDNISVDGNGFTSPVDNFNVQLNRARGDLDIPHAFNSSFAYTLPVGKDRRFAGSAPRWVDSLIGGWDIGLLMLWQSGQVLTYLSGRCTGPTAPCSITSTTLTGSSYANYSGDRNIGKVIRKGDGVYWLTPEEIGRFSYPAAGEIGTGGRNAFRGPRYFNVDVTLAKKFKIGDRYAVSFRAEAYNLFNNVNFSQPNADLSTPSTFGKITSTVGNPRYLQLALRYDF